MNDEETLALAQQLVRIDSVNPSLVPGAAGEKEIAGFVAEFLKGHGVEADVEEVAPGRPNVVSTLPGTGGGPSLLLCCHLDTVSVEGMVEPFSGRIEDGRLIGRGAQDVKGGLTAMLSAAVVLSKRPHRSDVIITGVADEEAYSAGTKALLEKGVRADMAIVFEPSDLEVVVAHKGFGWLRVTTTGVAAHGSRPKEGVDAIAHMGRFLVALESLADELAARDPHALLGTASVHASLIQGGRELSSYPDRCVLDLERRTLPGETEADIVGEIEWLVEALGSDARFKAAVDVELFRPAFEIDEAEPLPTGLRAAVEAKRGESRFAGMTGWTDSALLAEAGIPAVVFGPGGAGLHGIDEWGDTAQICQCRDILVDFAEKL